MTLMQFIEKRQPTPFDTLPIPGFFMLDGDLLFTLTRDIQFQHKTRPMIQFPSGTNRALWPSRVPEHLAEFYLFGELSLPVRATSAEVLAHVAPIADWYGYGVERIGEYGVEVWDERNYERYRVSYDPETNFVINVVSILTSQLDSDGE